MLFTLLTGLALNSLLIPAAVEAKSPVTCVEAQQTEFNATLLIGLWYEVARQPLPPRSYQCVQLQVSLEPATNSSLHLVVTYANDPEFLFMNQSMETTVQLRATNFAGYNISYDNGGVPTPWTVFKLLATDYVNYALVCGYTNATDMGSSFGVVLTRHREPNDTVLTGYEAMAAGNFTNFSNGQMSRLTQTSECYSKGSSSLSSIPLAVILLSGILSLYTI